MTAAPVRSFTRLAIAIVIAAVVVSAGVLSYSSFESTVTRTSTLKQVSASTLLQKPSSVVFSLEVNGTWYWADDISNDIVIGSPGYSYFLNGSVAFDGLTFQTICPPVYQGCPSSNSSSTVVWADVVQLNIKFPGGSNETVGRAGYFEPLPTYILTINHSSPRAGILVEYVNDYPHNSVPYAVFLLVSSCGGPPNLC